jgi:hypothetical protein
MSASRRETEDAAEQGTWFGSSPDQVLVSEQENSDEGNIILPFSPSPFSCLFLTNCYGKATQTEKPKQKRILPHPFPF